MARVTGADLQLADPSMVRRVARGRGTGSAFGRGVSPARIAPPGPRYNGRRPVSPWRRARRWPWHGRRRGFRSGAGSSHPGRSVRRLGGLHRAAGLLGLGDAVLQVPPPVRAVAGGPGAQGEVRAASADFRAFCALSRSRSAASLAARAVSSSAFLSRAASLPPWPPCGLGCLPECLAEPVEPGAGVLGRQPRHLELRASASISSAWRSAAAWAARAVSSFWRRSSTASGSSSSRRSRRALLALGQRLVQVRAVAPGHRARGQVFDPVQRGFHGPLE